jgi:mRNA interferase MazF
VKYFLISFPFTSASGSKLRPALVVLDTGDADVLAARITTQPYRTSWDVPVTDWRGAGLLAPSIVRLDKLATIEKRFVQRPLGVIQANDRANVAAVLSKMFSAW